MKPVLLVEWHGFEHHPPQSLIVEQQFPLSLQAP